MKSNNHLIISGLFFTLILFIWPIFMSISQPTGTEAEQLEWISKNVNLYKVQFFFAFLISPAIVYLMIVQLKAVLSQENISQKYGFVFITAYVVLNSISYLSQVVLVPAFLEKNLIDQATVWYFGSTSSISYFINQVGYFFWALGAFILFFHFIKEKGIIKAIGILYNISALLTFVAFAGLLINNSFMNSMTLYSGLVLLPIGVLTVFWGFKKGKTLLSLDN